MQLAAEKGSFGWLLLRWLWWSLLLMVYECVCLLTLTSTERSYAQLVAVLEDALAQLPKATTPALSDANGRMVEHVITLARYLRRQREFFAKFVVPSRLLPLLATQLCPEISYEALVVASILMRDAHQIHKQNQQQQQPKQPKQPLVVTEEMMASVSSLLTKALAYRKANYPSLTKWNGVLEVVAATFSGKFTPSVLPLKSPYGDGVGIGGTGGVDPSSMTPPPSPPPSPSSSSKVMRWQPSTYNQHLNESIFFAPDQQVLFNASTEAVTFFFDTPKALCTRGRMARLWLGWVERRWLCGGSQRSSCCCIWGMVSLIPFLIPVPTTRDCLVWTFFADGYVYSVKVLSPGDHSTLRLGWAFRKLTRNFVDTRVCTCGFVVRREGGMQWWDVGCISAQLLLSSSCLWRWCLWMSTFLSAVACR